MEKIIINVKYVFNKKTDFWKYIGAIIYLLKTDLKINKKNISKVFQQSIDIAGFTENMDFHFLCDILEIEEKDLKKYQKKAIKIFNEKI